MREAPVVVPRVGVGVGVGGTGVGVGVGSGFGCIPAMVGVRTYASVVVDMIQS